MRSAGAGKLKGKTRWDWEVLWQLQLQRHTSIWNVKKREINSGELEKVQE